jgi:hypothetical protein
MGVIGRTETCRCGKTSGAGAFPGSDTKRHALTNRREGVEGGRVFGLPAMR